MPSLIQILFYVFEMVFDFWFLLVLAPLQNRKSGIRNMVYAWAVWAVIRVILFFNPEPIPSLVIPEPLNTILFFDAGLILIAVWYLWSYFKSSRLRKKALGMSPVKYALILVLVVILCVGVYYGGGALLKWYQSRNASPTNTSAPISVPAISSEGEIESITQTGSTVEVIENETTTTNNCFSSNPTEIQTQRARSVEHLVVIEGEGGVTIGDIQLAQVPLLQILKISLEGKYGVQDKQTEERTYTIKFTTGANKWATHSVSWKYTWYIGEAKVKFPDGTEQIYTYKVRALLEPETVSIEKDCSQMPSETPTVSP